MLAIQTPESNPDRSINVRLLKSLRRAASYNPHGWGIASISDKSVAVSKAPTNALHDAGYEIASQDARSDHVIGHVRAASVGGPDVKNTHPFTRRYAGRTWTWAHNGTLPRIAFGPLPDGLYPEGTTDSELIGLAVMALVGDRVLNNATFEMIRAELVRLNQAGGSRHHLNFIMVVDGYLLAYHDVGGYVGLSWARTENLDDGEAGPGLVVASEELLPGDWDPIPAGHLMVFRNAQVVYATAGIPAPRELIERDLLLHVRCAPHAVPRHSLVQTESQAQVLDELVFRGLLLVGTSLDGSGQRGYYTNPRRRGEIDLLLKA